GPDGPVRALTGLARGLRRPASSADNCGLGDPVTVESDRPGGTRGFSTGGDNVVRVCVRGRSTACTTLIDTVHGGYPAAGPQPPHP
ncbi:hypothetical protein ACFQ61_34265, partial [Streptomyces sp. NPDC056500]|uniref:hypothetical protein n=1 Tax=Streptomyces sp. NPDC056500 TaxID=3345840 RepID=UPI0036AA34AE